MPIKNYVTVGGVIGAPRIRITWADGSELGECAVPLTRPTIERLIKDLAEALPHAPIK